MNIKLRTPELWNDIYRIMENSNREGALELPDKLRLAQRKQSFIRWFNQNEGLPEDDLND